MKRPDNPIPKTLVTCTLIVGCVLSATNVAMAADPGFYLSGAVNRLSADFKNQDDINFDDSDNTASVRAGYMFNNTFGMEVGYLDLGNYTATGDNPANRIDIDGNAFSLALVANFDLIPPLDLYLKAGGMNVQADSTSNFAGLILDRDEDETVAFGAVGLEFEIGDVNLFGEFSKVDTDTNDLSIDIATVGVKFEFGSN